MLTHGILHCALNLIDLDRTLKDETKPQKRDISLRIICTLFFLSCIIKRSSVATILRLTNLTSEIRCVDDDLCVMLISLTKTHVCRSLVLR